MSPMAQSLGKFSELKSQMEDFEAQLRASLNNRVSLASNLIQTYRDEYEELKDRQQDLIQKLDQLLLKEAQLQNEIESFRKDTDNAKTKLETFNLRKQQLESQRDVLLGESKELDGMLAEKEQELKLEQEKMRKQRRRDNPEVKIYEKLLGLHIDASQLGTLRFKFNNFDDKLLHRSCELVLDVSGDTFTILSTIPEISSEEELSELTDILNKSSDIPKFLAASRVKLISLANRV